MNTNKVLLTMIMLLCFNTAALSQKSDNIPPQWISELPQASNNTFEYRTATGIGNTLEKARQSCDNYIINSFSMAGGAIIWSDYTTTDRSNQTIINGKLDEIIERSSVIKTESKGNEREIYILVIDDYWEINKLGDYQATRLYAISQLHHPLFDDITISKKYKASSLGMRPFCPGVAQIYKGSCIKGGTFIGLELIGAAGVVTSITQISSYDRLMQEDPKHKTEYQDSKDMWTNINWGCIAFTAGVYIVNLVDAWFSPGAKRIIAYPQYNNNNLGLSMSYKF
jgi:hypothetical protein